MRLDRGRSGAAAGLDHVGIERALHQVAGIVQPLRLLLEDANELLADDLALLLRLDHPGQAAQEALLRVDSDQRHLELVAERGHHLVALVLAHQAAVDETHVSWSPTA
jgi:hypothetical protein